ncbi:hypothetical protein ACHAWF_012604 [Thalassiosira exigua]
MSASGGRRKRGRAAVVVASLCLSLLVFNVATVSRDLLLSGGDDPAEAVGDAPPSSARGGERRASGEVLLAPAPGDSLAYADFAGNRSRRSSSIAVGKGEACLVHVGKTAGSMIRCILDLDTPACPKRSRKAKEYEPVREATELGRLFANVPPRRGTVHMWDRFCAARPGLVVLSARNPIDRIRSDFHYSRCRADDAKCMEEKRFLYRDCFYEFRDLVSRGLHDFYDGAADAKAVPAHPEDMDCARRAWAYVSGNRQFYRFNHHWYNYEYYFNFLVPIMGCWGVDAKTLADPSVEPLDLARGISARLRGGSDGAGPDRPARCPGIVALRNEFLGRDWDRVEVLLGGDVARGDELFGKARINPAYETRKGRGNSSAIAPTAPSSSDDVDRSLLCRAMCRELQYYKLLLWLSANVDADDAEDSMRDLRRTCPREPSDVRRCDAASSDPRPAAGRRARRGGRAGIGAGKPRLTG